MRSVTIDPRAAHLIDALGLEPHPEGGHYRQTYRSSSMVQPADDRPSRAALTTIYFLLTAGDISRWHRVRSDEIWHFYEGAPLEILIADAAFRRIERRRLGLFGLETEPVRVVAADEWQAASSTGAFTLVGCTVGPGFEFANFSMLREDAVKADLMRTRHPDLTLFL